jgi:hypothetical protein
LLESSKGSEAVSITNRTHPTDHMSYILGLYGMTCNY